MDETTTAAIRTGFHDYFETANLELPDPIPARGTVEGNGWHVRFVRHESPPAVDFFAQNRMTNTRHVRIAADGSAESLENYQDAIITQPGEEDDWAKARQRQAEHNQRVTEILREKGLID
ncbi:MAG: hypothetical protein WDZ49_14520 [Litorilinea sp.]